MLAPLSCWTLKVSVTTRWPLMKTPNEPESTNWLATGLVLSFLSPAYNTAAQPRTATAPHRIRAIRVTAFLLVFRGFDQGGEFEPPLPQSARRFSRRFPA